MAPDEIYARAGTSPCGPGTHLPYAGTGGAVLAKKGERVFKGQNLAVLESMKMESGVASPIDGVIAEIKMMVGQPVEAGEVLVRFQEQRET
jgi:propionyl-CoA carboxylase alpha chain